MINTTYKNKDFFLKTIFKINLSDLFHKSDCKVFSQIRTFISPTKAVKLFYLNITHFIVSLVRSWPF